MIILSSLKGKIYLVDTIHKRENLQLYTRKPTFHIKNQEVVVNFEKTEIILKNPDNEFSMNLGTIGPVTIIGYYKETEYKKLLEKLAHHKNITLTESTLILKQDDRELNFIRTPKTKNP